MNMKETTKRPLLARRIALLLAAVLMLGALTPMLSACMPGKALTLDGVSIDKEMYAFWFSMSKTDVMRRYGIKSTQDNEAFWASECLREGKEGMTWGEVVTAEVNRAIKIKLASALLYDELGLKMAESQKKKVNSYVDDMIEYVAEGDKAVLREKLEAYGSSLAALRRCAAFDLKADLVESYLARNGSTMLSAEEKASFYNDNYYRVLILYINDEFYGSYENGVRVEEELDYIVGPGAQNDSDKALLATILAEYYETGKLPDDFDKTFATLLSRSDEQIHAEGIYPSGIYVSRDIDLYEAGLLEEAVYEAAVGLRPGQLVHVSAEEPSYEESADEKRMREALGGERYVYGLPLNTGAYDEDALAPFFADFYTKAAARALSARSIARIGDVLDNIDNIADITAATVPCNLTFKLCRVD